MLLTLTVQIGLHSNLFNKYHVCFTFIIPLASFFGLAKVYNGYSSKLEVSERPARELDLLLARGTDDSVTCVRVMTFSTRLSVRHGTGPRFRY